MQQHEYSVIGGLNRAKIGHAIGIVAAAMSSLLITAAAYLIALASKHGITTPTIVFWPLTAMAIYGLLFTIFDRYFWKLPLVAELLKVPDLSGEWVCQGQTINPDRSAGYQWQARVTIVQSWDKIRVRLKTDQSGSSSVSAALVFDDADGYRLMYSYKNEPRIGELELKAHLGHAELIFSKDLQTAEGEYFNGRGRFTFGTMKLRRES